MVGPGAPSVIEALDLKDAVVIDTVSTARDRSIDPRFGTPSRTDALVRPIFG